jgi:cellulose synthase/poly-beta-1,6-N-acetylglucosamine synthase-like glycosyltransferase
MLEIFIIVVTVFYLFQISLFLFGTFKSRLRSFKTDFPIVSVIIAARNEEKNIGLCLDSITRLDYPTEKLEIIIVNDHSTDATGQIISGFIGKYTNIRTFIPENEKDGLKGKTNAIAQAIDQAKGEIIFTSDADCILPKTWIQDTLKYYETRTGIVCGFTYVEHETIFQGMQSLDWIYLLAIASGSFSLGIPLSCVGNNMSFRKKTYDEVGGFKNLNFSVTEDFALLQAIVQRTNWRCKFPFEKNNLVFSRACPTWTNLIRQKKRWGTGGKKSPLPGLLLMSAGWTISGLVFVVPFLNLSPTYILLPILSKCLLDSIFLFVPLKFFNLLKLFIFFPFFEIYYSLYVFALPFLVFINQKVKWKGRVYS